MSKISFRSIIGLFSTTLVLLLALPVWADDISELRNLAEEQGRLIENLQKKVEDLQQTDAAQAEADQAPKKAEPGKVSEDEPAVTTEYVDERIQDFEESPSSRFLISGYGTMFYVNNENSPDLFGASFNPGFHFRMADRLHFNGEMELAFDALGGQVETEVGLEFAQVDFIATDSLVLSGGKFLAPFNTFGTRQHPNWINKMASVPPIYGQQHKGGIIPVLKNFGTLASGGRALWSDSAKINYAAFVANGANATSNPTNPAQVLHVEFSEVGDLGNVTTGGRVGFLPIANLEIGVSYMTGSPDGGRYHMAGGDFWYYRTGLELRGEFLYLTRSAAGIEADVWGYWGQAAYRLRYLFPERMGFRGVLNRLEGVVRWGQILDQQTLNRNQLALGVNFWVFESAALKMNYEFNSGAVRADRFFIQFAYGF